jgi:hypothetical protein
MAGARAGHTKFGNSRSDGAARSLRRVIHRATKFNSFALRFSRCVTRRITRTLCTQFNEAAALGAGAKRRAIV